MKGNSSSLWSAALIPQFSVPDSQFGRAVVAAKPAASLAVSMTAEFLLGLVFAENWEPGTENCPLALGLCFEFYLSILHFDRIHDRLALVFFADLGGFLFHEGGEGIQAAGNFFSRLLLGCAQRFVE